ncbi:MAG TPA: deoxynucleoside kinase [Allosphingosinicella sp.]|jgi:deoxyadenosine/deoxycytidine kinase|nr:deoxynucleoside kinase [Allosphingosinicella sp.]
MRIEICGGIGAGKTTIAQVLSELLACPLVSETYRSVPFWEPFFKNPKRYSFQKNVGFALSHGERLHASLDLEHSVSDFALFQDLAYAEISQDQEEFHVVNAIYDRMVRLVGYPSILVRVSCRPDRQHDRIKQRGRIAEHAAELGFICDLNSRVEQKALALTQRAGVPYFELDTTEWGAADLPDEWSSRLAPIIASFRAQS